MAMRQSKPKSDDTENTEGYPMPLERPPDDEEEEEEDEEEKRLKDEVVPFLLKHAYHLPGNNWVQDWWQYMTNNHPVFGICLHHKYHPLGWKIRAIGLLGSILLGLALTNLVYLAFVFVEQDAEKTLLDTSSLYGLINGTSTTASTISTGLVASASVTTGNLVLWLVGAPIHGFYDSIAWALMGCGCCRFNSNLSWWALWCRRSGAFMVTFGVIVITCVASFASLLRAALEADQDVEISINLTDTAINTTAIGNFTNTLDDNSTLVKMEDTSFQISDSGALVQEELLTLVQERDFANYEFVLSFFVELLLSYIVFYPLVGTLFFMGVFSCCGRYPIFHGRQYEVEQLQKKQQAEETMEPGIEVELGIGNGMEDYHGSPSDPPLVEQQPPRKSKSKPSKKKPVETKPLIKGEVANSATSALPKEPSTIKRKSAKPSAAQKQASTKPVPPRSSGKQRKSTSHPTSDRQPLPPPAAATTKKARESSSKKMRKETSTKTAPKLDKPPPMVKTQGSVKAAKLESVSAPEVPKKKRSTTKKPKRPSQTATTKS